MFTNWDTINSDVKFVWYWAIWGFFLQLIIKTHTSLRWAWAAMCKETTNGKDFSLGTPIS